MSTANKLTYLNGTKQAIKQAINEDFEVIDDNTTFREYAEEISSNNAKYKDLIPKETKNATNTLDISNSSGLDKALVTQYGNTYQETTTGKNLFDNVYGQTENVYTKHINAPSPLGSVDCYPINLSPNTQYTLKIDMNGYQKTGAWIAGVCFENGDVISLLQLNSMADITTTTFTTDSTGVVYVGQRYGFTYGTTGRMDLFLQTAKIQLKKGSSATSYEKFTGGNPAPNPDYPKEIVNISGSTIINITDNNNHSKNYNIDLPFELCKIGDYKDRIYPLNGKWYLEKKIGKVVFDGSEAWRTAGEGDTTNGVSMYWGISDVIAVATKDLISDYFRFIPRSSVSSTTINFITGGGGDTIVLNIAKTSLETQTLAGFKTWLSTHNAIVYYILNTPTTTEITENNYPTLYNQLNNIKLYEGVNHLTFTNESGLDVEFDIEYYKDWKLD